MENQTSPQPEQQPRPAPSNKKPGYYFSKLQWTFLGIAFGGIVGYFAATHAAEFMVSITPTLITIGLTVSVVIILLIIVLPNFLNYYIKRYTKQDVDVESLVGDLQSKTTDISVALSDAILANTDPKIKANIQADLPKVLYYFVFSRLRNTGLRFLMTTFAAIAGLMGTILLYNQNQLLQKQNEKIDTQITLEEASRRSSLNFLLANALDKIDEELKNSKNVKRKLSPELVGRISSLSQSLQPYYFVENGKLTIQPYSPERGSLLLAIVNSDLDTATLDSIFKQTTFDYAYLDEAVLSSKYLKDINLVRASLNKASFRNANLEGANFFSASLSETNFAEAKLSRADFDNADLFKSNFSMDIIFVREDEEYIFSLNPGITLFGPPPKPVDLSNANFSRARLVEARFSGANLNGANFSEANVTNADGLTFQNLYAVSDASGVIGLPFHTRMMTLLKRSRISLKGRYKRPVSPIPAN